MEGLFRWAGDSDTLGTAQGQEGSHGASYERHEALFVNFVRYIIKILLRFKSEDTLPLEMVTLLQCHTGRDQRWVSDLVLSLALLVPPLQ